MPTQIRAKVFLLGISIAFGLLSGEALLRYLGHSSSDGNFYLGSIHLRPYYVPVRSIEEKLHAYLASPTSFIMYDPLLGWAPRPGSRSMNGIYSYNADGIRTGSNSQVTPPTARPGILRIALFGDSFTHGDDVSFENTWGYSLERNLRAAGIDAEVLNFGVGGYGTDQAFLRWKEKGRVFSPQIVLLGFCSENVKRNVNMIRALYYPETGIPFFKPRYILENGTLRLVDSPTPDPEQIVGILDHISSWDLIRYEHWITPRDYTASIWVTSRLISFMLHISDTLRGNPAEDVYRPEGEPARVTMAIIDSFKREVESGGGKFYLVHLPNREGLKLLMRGKQLPYADLLKQLETIAPMIHVEESLTREALSGSSKKLFVAHYTPAANRIVADTVSKLLIAARAVTSYLIL
ncbi:MAG: SGNH/GDSL hydrolase family protein [Candidatus Aureabacteria bacterium]|nr:SGNH/GDSL hydrolase family protein [Candidatus Auribacterota bacterium]